MNNKGFFLVEACMFILSTLTGFITLIFTAELDEGVTIGGFILFPIFVAFLFRLVFGDRDSGSSSHKGDDKK